MDTINRLQFRHHSDIFQTREEAVEYIMTNIRNAESGMAKDDPQSPYGYSLFAEPTVLRYGTEEDTHIILAIGAKTNDSVWHEYNKFCIIDIDKTEQEIEDLRADLEAAIRSLTVIALDSNTIGMHSEKTDDGTYVSGDVKTAETHIFDNTVKYNNLAIFSPSRKGPEGLFIYVDLTYDESTETFTFTVSQADGTLKNTSVKLSNDYVVSGAYKKEDESIHLYMKSGSEVVISCEDLIAEWDVEGEASKTPVVLTREEVDYDHTDEHHHVEPWQDVLRADVRIKDERKILMPDGNYKYVKDENSTNILDRTSDGRYLYVDGKASNIIYYMNGEKTTVKAALDGFSNIKLSTDNDNIIVNKTDGFFASTKLSYVSKENKLVFKASGQEDTVIKLNGFKLFESIYYDPTQEALVITYIDGNDKLQIVTIPIGEMIRDWEWEPQNEGHNVKIVKKRNIAGNDKVSADVKIYDDPDNILVDKSHELFVKGTADNIKYGDSTVKDALDAINDKNEEQDDKLDELDDKIGTGFTDDPHDNVTYKFEQLQNQVNEEVNKLQNEIDRSASKDNEHDVKIQVIEDEIGEGFSQRNTVRDEINRNRTAIEALDVRISSAETDINRLDSAITEEINVRTVADETLNRKIEQETANRIQDVTDERNRATTEEERILHLLEDETNRAETAEMILQSSINSEKSRAIETETRIETALNNEINRATTKENELEDAIDELEDAIQSATLTFEDTHSINFNNPQQENNVVKADVKIANAPDNIILIDDVKDGVYASVDLTYIPSSNTLKFKVNGEEKVFPIAAGSILDSAWYDPVTKNLVFRTKTASGEFVEITIPAYDLFNAWEVDNKPEGCALELNLVTGRTDPTSHEPLPDQLWGRVLISPLEDNQLTIDTNGLYVSSSSATIAQCVSGKTDKLYELLYGEGEAMANCGENTRYKPYVGSCVISAATSFNEADRLLNDKICQILNMWVSGITCTNESSWIEDGMNRKLQVDARLSHGKYATMTDEDLYTDNIEGAYIDPTNTEFTDTNALRIVCLSEGSSGVTPAVETKQNGIYLSNVWNCGLYYDASTPADQEAKGKAQAAGYNTNYSTDDDSSARNYNYMNNVRQHDI